MMASDYAPTPVEDFLDPGHPTLFPRLTPEQIDYLAEIGTQLTFARGASIPDPSRLFNSSLEGNTRRAIDIHEGEKVDAGAFKALVKAAVAQNGPSAKKR